MAIFVPKAWVKPFAKRSIFGLFELLVFIPQKIVFSFQNIVKGIFLPYIAWKNKLPKSPFLDQNDGKMLIFRLFELLVVIALKSVFWLQNIVKDIFLADIAKKKKLPKWPFLCQKHGLTPLQKGQFFDLLNFFFLQPRKASFRSRIL